MSKCFFSVDVEDWFHFLNLSSTPEPSTWESLPSHVEKNLIRILDILERRKIKSTCFFLGWIAKKYPGLVKETIRRGHEIASHGFYHKLAFQMTEAEFFEDAASSKKLLEDVSGQQVLGYRAPGFSLTQNTPWFFKRLIEAGYVYDSSLFPTKLSTKLTHGGGISTNKLAPHVMVVDGNEIVEFPVSVRQIMGQPICFFGGAWLRIFPYSLIKKSAIQVLAKDRPVGFYVHPREIDPKHPRLAMNLVLRLPAYFNLKSTAIKISKLSDDFSFVTFSDYAKQHRATLEKVVLTN